MAPPAHQPASQATRTTSTKLESLTNVCYPRRMRLRQVGREHGLAILVLAFGCEEALELPPVVWEGANVQVATNLDLNAWCGGSLPRLDAYTAALKERFDVPDDHGVTYVLLEPPIHAHDACPENARACARDGMVLTTEMPDDHELVHAISTAHDSLPTVFEEGSASYWGAVSGRPEYRGLKLFDLLDSWNSRYLSPGEYALAAHFTSYLVHNYGHRRYATLAEATYKSQSRSSFESTFGDIFGVSLTDAAERYEQTWPHCDIESTQSSFHTCAEPAIVLTGSEHTDLDFDVNCGNPSVIGPRQDWNGDVKIWEEIAVSLETPNYQQVVELLEPHDPPEGLRILIKRCDTECAKVELFSRELGPDTFSPDLWGVGDEALAVRGWSFLGQASGQAPEGWAAGRYVVRVSRDHDDAGRVRIRWRP